MKETPSLRFRAEVWSFGIGNYWYTPEEIHAITPPVVYDLVDNKGGVSSNAVQRPGAPKQRTGGIPEGGVYCLDFLWSTSLFEHMELRTQIYKCAQMFSTRWGGLLGDPFDSVSSTGMKFWEVCGNVQYLLSSWSAILTWYARIFESMGLRTQSCMCA